MSPSDILKIVEFWQEKGLTTHREESGKPVEWIDICVTEFFGPTLTLPARSVSLDAVTMLPG